MSCTAPRSTSAARRWSGLSSGAAKSGSGARKAANSGSSVGFSAPALDQAAHHGGRHIGVFRQAGHAARQAVFGHRQHAPPGIGQPGGIGIAFDISDAAGFGLERAPRAQRHRQDRARRVEGIVRHPIDEIAQARRAGAEGLPAARRSSAGCRRRCLRRRPTPRPGFRGCPGARQPACPGPRLLPGAVCSHRRPPAAKAAGRPRVPPLADGCFG